MENATGAAITPNAGGDVLVQVMLVQCAMVVARACPNEFEEGALLYLVQRYTPMFTRALMQSPPGMGKTWSDWQRDCSAVLSVAQRFAEAAGAMAGAKTVTRDIAKNAFQACPFGQARNVWCTD